MMPEMDGWKVLNALKQSDETASIPVVMLTMVDNRNLGYALGAADYLTKPLERERLSTILRRHICPSPPCPALIIDDDERERLLLRRSIQREGWNVMEASNGKEALEQLEQCVPHLILLDLSMPVMDGFEFSLRLRETRSGGKSQSWC